MERSRFIQGERVKVLLVEDDEDDYILTRSVFSEIKGWQSELEWINNFPAGPTNGRPWRSS